jgi:hypothetical protein
MQKYAGREAKIVRVWEDSYYLDIDDGVYLWQDWMFDPNYKADGPLPAEDAIRVMLDGETLYNEDGDVKYFWSAGCFRVVYPDSDEMEIVDSFNDATFYRRPTKSRRGMTRLEVLDWANSKASRRWVVRWQDNAWAIPQFFGYDKDISGFQRARLLPDRSGVDESTIQGFEVEA